MCEGNLQAPRKHNGGYINVCFSQTQHTVARIQLIYDENAIDKAIKNSTSHVHWRAYSKRTNACDMSFCMDIFFHICIYALKNRINKRLCIHDASGENVLSKQIEIDFSKGSIYILIAKCKDFSLSTQNDKKIFSNSITINCVSIYKA